MPQGALRGDREAPLCVAGVLSAGRARRHGFDPEVVQHTAGQNVGLGQGSKAIACRAIFARPDHLDHLFNGEARYRKQTGGSRRPKCPCISDGKRPADAEFRLGLGLRLGGPATYLDGVFRLHTIPPAMLGILAGAATADCPRVRATATRGYSGNIPK